jgi:L-lactate dehydrogenase (cytochrome)
MTCIEDLRAAAQRRVPRMFYDYVASGSWTETTLRANESYFNDIQFRQRILVDIEKRSLAWVPSAALPCLALPCLVSSPCPPRLVSDIELGLMPSSSQMVGQNVAMPVALSPCGFGGMMWPNGEAHAARAAEKFGVPFSREMLCPARLLCPRGPLRE